MGASTGTDTAHRMEHLCTFVLYDSLDERLWSLKLPKSGTMPLKNRSLARGVKLVVNCSSKVVHKCLVRQPV